jgi:hypothetical protein
MYVTAKGVEFTKLHFGREIFTVLRYFVDMETSKRRRTKCRHQNVYIHHLSTYPNLICITYINYFGYSLTDSFRGTQVNPGANPTTFEFTATTQAL